jgi:predicted deacylase
MGWGFLKRIITLVIILAICYAIVYGLVTVYKNNAVKVIPIVPIKVEKTDPIRTVVGTSVEGRAIEAYTYGRGTNKLLFVGGIHGGYEWNSVFLAYKFIDYLTAYPEIIPKNITVTIIPSANPDGMYKITGKVGRFNLTDVPATELTIPGRLNAHNVDLNRNFDCSWKPIGVWKGNNVSGGTAAFSEPEAKALRDYVLKENPKAVILWHSQANSVYASQCKAGILPVTLDIMNAYSKASGYSAVKTFDSYEVNGALEDWLASIKIPAITVELKTHETIEWEQNLAGVKSLFSYFGVK